MRLGLLKVLRWDSFRARHGGCALGAPRQVQFLGPPPRHEAQPTGPRLVPFSTEPAPLGHRRSITCPAPVPAFVRSAGEGCGRHRDRRPGRPSRRPGGRGPVGRTFPVPAVPGPVQPDRPGAGAGLLLHLVDLVRTTDERDTGSPEIAPVVDHARARVTSTARSTRTRWPCCGRRKAGRTPTLNGSRRRSASGWPTADPEPAGAARLAGVVVAFTVVHVRVYARSPLMR